MGRIDDKELGFHYEPSFEIRREALKEGLEQLGIDGDTLAVVLGKIGDLRDLGIKMRRIRQMLDSRDEVPNELLALLDLLKRQMRRVNRLYGQLEWHEAEDGSIHTEAEGFAISLWPKSQGRYKIEMQHSGTGYRPPWPKWQYGIEKAKFVAVMTLDDALSHLDELMEDGKISRSQLSP